MDSQLPFINASFSKEKLNFIFFISRIHKMEAINAEIAQLQQQLSDCTTNPYLADLRKLTSESQQLLKDKEKEIANLRDKLANAQGKIKTFNIDQLRCAVDAGNASDNDYFEQCVYSISALTPSMLRHMHKGEAMILALVRIVTKHPKRCELVEYLWNIMAPECKTQNIIAGNTFIHCVFYSYNGTAIIKHMIEKGLITHAEVFEQIAKPGCSITVATLQYLLRGMSGLVKIPQ